MNLYEIPQEYNAIIESTEDNDGVLTEDQLKRIEELEDEFELRAENIVKLQKTLEAEREGIKAEAERLRQKAHSKANQIKSLKEYLKDSMTKMGLKKVKTKYDLFTISIQNNSRPKIIWTGAPNTIPPIYRKPPEVDGTKVYEAWRAGALTVDEEAKYTWEIIHGNHLRIK